MLLMFVTICMFHSFWNQKKAWSRVLNDLNNLSILFEGIRYTYPHTSVATTSTATIGILALLIFYLFCLRKSFLCIYFQRLCRDAVFQSATIAAFIFLPIRLTNSFHCTTQIKARAYNFHDRERNTNIYTNYAYNFNAICTTQYSQYIFRFCANSEADERWSIWQRCEVLCGFRPN